jgi:4-aminobutyrate aminotransferase
VRGKGLMLGMELVEDRTTKAPATKLTEKVITQAYRNGMLLLSCGVSTIRFMPPLLVTRENVDEAIAILDASLGETQNA